MDAFHDRDRATDSTLVAGVLGYCRAPVAVEGLASVRILRRRETSLMQEDQPLFQELIQPTLAPEGYSCGVIVSWSVDEGSAVFDSVAAGDWDSDREFEVESDSSELSV